jgi:hypothetical protein
MVRAVRLDDGSTMWTHKGDGRPVAVVNDRVAIQADIGRRTFRVELLDKANGAPVVSSQPIDFSQTVAGNFEVSPSVSAEQVGDALVLKWSISTLYSGGANPPPALAKPGAQSMVEAEMDLRTGKVLIIKDRPPAATSHWKWKEIPSQDAVQYVRNGQWAASPWHLDGVSIALVQDASSGKLYVLINGQTRSLLKSTTQSKANVVSSPPLVTGDGRYVLLESRDSQWEVFSALEGTEVGHVAARSLSEPCVVGPRLYYRSVLPAQEPNTSETIVLVAQDLRTGRVLWNQELENIRHGNRPILPR